MNEQRLQTYYQLIESLLNCPGGEEPAILAANTELLDAGFVEVLEAVAGNFSQQGEENAANWLRNLANQLNAALNLPSTTVPSDSETPPIIAQDLEAYGQFLQQVLLATEDSNGDAQVVYPLLVANTDKLNNIFAQLLRSWATNTLAEAEADAAEYFAAVIGNFSNLVSNFPLGSKASNIEISITGYEIALTVFTRNAFPQDWAMTQNNLGNAYGNRILGERAENLELAITAFSAALEVLTKNAFPQNHAETLLNLGMTYQNTEQFNLAYSTFVSAITTVESLRGDIFSGEESKRKQAEEWNQLYRRMVEVCLELGNITEAIEYVERSKTRSLVELILDRDFKTIFPPEVVPQLEQLRDEIASGQYQLQNGKAENPKALPQHLQELRQQRQELLDQYLPIGSGFKFDSFQAILDNRTAIIEWYITAEKILAFVIKPDGQELTFWESQLEELNSLIDWRNEYLVDYYRQKEQWQNQLGERLKRLADILHLEEILTLIPKSCDRLILIPHRFLHLFPLHALPVQESYLLDLFPNGVGYAPSCQLLQQLQLRQRPDFQSLFAIQNPTEDLYLDYEKDLGAVATIKKQFTDAEILKQDKAKKSAILHVDENTNNVILNEKLLNANCAFFFCHGSFNFESPLDSGLQLADDNLTLAEIIAYFKLKNCRLVTLSACETGVTDFTSTSDEYIGLPSGFLLAGSTNVVSSLWTVSATATALLMIKFYEELQQQSKITLALNTAQRWLRDTTVKGFQDWLSNSPLLRVWQTELYQGFDKMGVNPETAKPFESPYYWSAFCAIGKGV